MAPSGNTNVSAASSSVVYDSRTGQAIVSDGSSIKIRPVAPLRLGGPLENREVPWLGAAVEEAPEVLSAQLGLDPGVGLVVTYVATNSPAAKAGLQKNDVLAEFDDQKLVHPMQFRKLVQVRKEGDTVKLVFYRAGKRQTVTATLAKTAAGFDPFDRSMMGQPFLPMNGATAEAQILDAQSQARRQEIQALITDLQKSSEPNRRQTQYAIRRSVDESRRSLDQARRAYEQALRSGTNTNAEVDSLSQSLEDLAKSKVVLDKRATVTVRSTGSATKSIVKADDSGTIVIIKNPKLHLTVHDQDGKLVYDGEIETPEQRAQVPPEVWKKAEPLLDKLTPSAEQTPEPKSGSF